MTPEMRFNPPPNWPRQAPRWKPAADWQPPAEWGPLPLGWPLWLPKKRSGGLVAAGIIFGVGGFVLFGARSNNVGGGPLTDVFFGCFILGIVLFIRGMKRR